ncbi:helix-turn-helix domain-containing protein [Streptomyces sp. NPDC006668]|uniref:TetR/AcrR family transcriptional regulator n=1 Tax=Streptomyces sp. NPDC006668 TaxID=3156903 RepID=UPI003404F1D1
MARAEHGPRVRQEVALRKGGRHLHAPYGAAGLVENEIFEEASRVFTQRGFAGTNLQDIAEAMGITRPALYDCVKSKDDLLAKLVAQMTERPTGRPLSASVHPRLRAVLPDLPRPVRPPVSADPTGNPLDRSAGGQHRHPRPDGVGGRAGRRWPGPPASHAGTTPPPR